MNFSWEIIFLLILLGFGVGILKTIAGAGGGVFFVSFMVLFMSIPFDVARDTSIFVMVIGSLTAFTFYLKQERTNLKLVLIFSCFSILGSFLCWIFLLIYPINNEILKIIFSIAVFFTAANMILKIFWDIKKNENVSKYCEAFEFDSEEIKKQLKIGVPFFILAGFLAHLLGIGGGIINTPSCFLILGMPIHASTATSTGIIFFTAIFNVVLKILYGNINYFVGVCLALGAGLGAILGSKISYKMPKTYLQAFVAIVLIILGLEMIISVKL
ncbi:MAG: sulfite exporter TauE/SafE family protein [Promethearchaeia archaeon]